MSILARPIHIWLLFMGIVFVCGFMLFQQGWFKLVLDNDRTFISAGIIVALGLVSLLAAWRSWIVSKHMAIMNTVADQRASSNNVFDQALHNAENEIAMSDRMWDAIETELRRGNDLGWLVADLMIKLGLLGTVIGFIIMLGSISDIDTFDINSLQDILLRMSDGMRIALFTTLTGLVGAMLTGIQFHILDRATDRLLLALAQRFESSFNSDRL